ncbi:MAG: alpha/beta fold hydrolase [Flavobacteriales bacterium]
MPVVLIHGALGSSEQLRSLAKRIAPFDPILVELSGHGQKPVPPEGLSYARFLEDITEVIEGNEQVHLFGYSMGGYAATLFAARYPERVASVCTLGSKLIWDEAGLQALLKRLDADALAKHVPAYAERLAKEHGTDRWRELVKATAELVTRDFHAPLLQPEVFARVACPVLVCSGDRDDMALAKDSLEAAARFPKAGALILPQTKHPFDFVDLDLLVPFLQRLWTSDLPGV